MFLILLESNSYFSPTYLFLDSRIKGIKVFSYSRSCGYFNTLLILFPASIPNLIDSSTASFPLKGFLFLSNSLNFTNTESVSPYTIFDPSYSFSINSLAMYNCSLPVAVVAAAISFQYIALVLAPICPYKEFAVTLYANCKQSRIPFSNLLYLFLVLLYQIY